MNKYVLSVADCFIYEAIGVVEVFGYVLAFGVCITKHTYLSWAAVSIKSRSGKLVSNARDTSRPF